MKTIGQPTIGNRHSCLRALLFIIIGCSLPCSIFILKYSQWSTDLPRNPNYGIIDRQDEWQYQNSVTGEWYYWRTVYKKQHNDTEWRVKWLNVAPTSSLGVIVYLAPRYELDLLNQSLFQLSRMLSNNPRPVVIFHDGDFDDNATQQALAHTLGARTPLGFERIKFFNSPKAPWLLPRGSASKYFDMCRFFTLMLPSHPLLTLFSLYWRLDSHSYIFAEQPIKDPFEIMQKRQIQYAFIMVVEEDWHFIPGLWSFFQNFSSRHSLKPSVALRETQTDANGGYALHVVFNNFAIANVSLFRDHPLIQAWLHAVDRDGGIYRHRWGDAPIHTLAVTQFLERDQVLRLRYFGYVHRFQYACASGVEGDLCKKQAEPFIKQRRSIDYYFKDGCWPTTRMPLCHYYPEIR